MQAKGTFVAVMFYSDNRCVDDTTRRRSGSGRYLLLTVACYSWADGKCFGEEIWLSLVAWHGGQHVG
jgi:hypothetical protein